MNPSILPSPLPPRFATSASWRQSARSALVLLIASTALFAGCGQAGTEVSMPPPSADAATPPPPTDGSTPPPTVDGTTPPRPADDQLELNGAQGADQQSSAGSAPATGAPVFAHALNGASSPITVGALVADGATTETLSLFLPVPAGDTDNDSVAIVDYRAADAANWSQALDLYKNHRSQVAPYAGMIFGLRPDTEYEVRVTVRDPDGVDGAAEQRLRMRTRAVPPVIRALDDNTVRVATTAALNTAIDRALPGQVILLAPGRYDGRIRIYRRNGTEKSPITIRGADGLQSVITGNGEHWAVMIEESSYIHIEQLAIRDAKVGVEIRDWSKSGRATAGNVIRNNHISRVDDGIVATSDGGGAPAHRHLYIADNVLEGNNAFGDVSNATWDDEGIVVVAESSEIVRNTLSGFGDSLGFSRDQSRAVDIHHNYVKYGGDDGVELDFGNRNVVARENLLTNTGDGISFQYIINGPGYAYRNLIYNVLPGRGPYKVKPEAECNDGVFVLGNTSVNSGRAFINNSACGKGFFFVDNLFTGDRTEQDIVRLDSSRFNQLTWSHNAFIYDGYVQFNDFFVTSFAAFKATPRGATDVLITQPVVFRDADLIGKDAQDGLGAQRSVANRDFRLAPGSQAIGAGKVLPTITDGYAGRAPDIGAFQSNAGSTRYGARTGTLAPDTTAVVAQTVAPPPDFVAPPVSITTPAPHNEVNDIDAIPVGQWAELAGTKMESIIPKAYFEEPVRGVMGPAAIMLAWGGGAFDSSRNRLLVWGGGHADYAGNEVYAFDANEARWHRLTDASNPPARSVEAAADGNPVSRHTYGGVAYLPNLDKMIAHGGARHIDGNPTPTTWLFDLKTNRWEQKVVERLGAGHSVVTAYDRTTGTALQFDSVLTRYDPASDQWTRVFEPSSASTYGRYGAFDATRNQVFYLGDKKAFVYDLNAKTHQEVTLSGDTAVQDGWYPGVVFVESTDRYYIWSGGASIYEITPGSWSVRVLPLAKGSAVPTEGVTAGTYGRFQFVPSKNAFIAVNSISENVFAYKLDASGAKRSAVVR